MKCEDFQLLAYIALYLEEKGFVNKASGTNKYFFFEKDGISVEPRFSMDNIYFAYTCRNPEKEEEMRELEKSVKREVVKFKTALRQGEEMYEDSFYDWG